MGDYLDMHLHTKYSDGELDISTILDILKYSNVGTFSITDHDDICSSRYMKCTDHRGLNYIRGVEISSKMGKYGMHILGYNFNFTENMDKFLAKIRILRREKILKLFEKIQEIHGIKIEPEDIHNLMVKPGVVGKANAITLLHKSGCEGTNKEIHQRYVKGIKTGICIDADIDESIGIIKEANGIPILAHPKEIESHFNIDINEIIKDLVDRGIEGIEVYNSLHTLEDIKRFLEITKKYNLLISGGSDYHGPFTKKDTEIGHVSKEYIKIKQLSLVDRIHEIGLVA